ncbi:MAG: trigger factor [Rickettsiales bacterium]|jgi:trigger factor|nr:trigger factor [Rickettsiales bacterium]
MIKRDKIRGLHYTIEGALASAELAAAESVILTKYGEKVKMDGFRPGHIPLNVLKARVGDGALRDAVNDLIEKDLNAFAAEKKLRLADHPKFNMPEIIAGKDVEYSVEFDVLPELPEINLEKITLVRKTAEVADSEIDKALANIAKARAQYNKCEDGRAAANGDICVIDFKGFVGGEAFAGGEASKHHLELGSGQFIAGFEDQIIGHKVGDKFNVNVKFPDNYGAENLAGKPALFEVLVHEIRAPQPVTIDDALAKEIGQESLSSLRDHIKKILAEQYEQGAAKFMREELLDVLSEKVKLDLPEVLIEKEIAFARRDAEQHAEKFDERAARKNSERRVKLGLILAEWGAAQKVEVPQAEVQQAIFQEAYRSGANPQSVIEYYSKNPDALAMIRGALYEQKVLSEMVARTEKKDKAVNAEELFSQKI